MNVIRPEKLDTKQAEMNVGEASEVEAGIHDLVHNEGAHLGRPMANDHAIDIKAGATASNVNSLIQRVAGTSLSEIENVIAELEDLRELLNAEGQRVQREISGYAQLSQTAIKSTRVIADNVAQWKRSAEGSRNDQ
jgi:hypothetical protein